MTKSLSQIEPADWITLCQSELAALAVDREFAEGLSAATEAWNLAAWRAAQQTQQDEPPRRAPSDEPPRPSPRGAASDDGGTSAKPRRRNAGPKRGGKAP